MAITPEHLAIILFTVAIVGIACMLVALFLLFRNQQQGTKKPANVSCSRIGNSFLNRTDIYRRAIKRTFANLYGVSPDAVHVSWTTGKIIVVQCAGKTLLHPIPSDPDDDAPEFTCLEEDPVIVNLTDDEWRRLELTV
jgi:hypothetical protein